MILDAIKKAGKYYDLSHGIRAGLEFLSKTDFSEVENGRIEIVEGVYANVQTYDSKPLAQGKFEAHRDYIDIQYVIEGEELVAVANLTDCEELIPYDCEKDIEFLSYLPAKKPEMIELKPDRFLLLYPDDAHMPSITTKEPQPVKKVVVKIRL